MTVIKVNSVKEDKHSCLDHAEYLGDDSIITVSEATELLLEGRYYSSVPAVNALYLEDAP